MLKNDHNGLTVCYDMGLNKRSTGTRYDSISGQGIMIGARSGKVTDFKTISKNVGNVTGLEGLEGLVDDPEDDIEHTIIQPFPIELNFVETVLFDGTLHNDGGDLWGSPLSGDDSTAPYLHRQCSVIVGDVSVTLGLPHMEAIG